MGKDCQGFTLIELLGAVLIVALLAGIAYPGYTRHVKKAYRAEIAALLMDQARSLELFYTRNGTFIDASGISEGNDRYRISAALQPQAFSLSATPVLGSMMADDPCGEFSLASNGERSNPGAAPEMSRRACWGQ
ncbi:prepilin-type N-terminal cleavage/methylation domain-containing protein [Pseudomonas tolaasii]|uniref:Prepilin-type N-terminal cleavage/methylation domain-containing protein n=2 Tax=Pseudomonas tolaasii TaxID=29442 RepID=A0A7Y8AM18_PSETO|nr:type IV pilin protein [Pseudomonas tolaasii]ARB27350.1 pilus assembly protein [Pseudomonas tolaasii]KAB0475952.1 prepilin-type N-terminal cleavage/methylation domain-containing protein [Pseudomonas tolaasii]MBY8940763.1 prepilin-type N-terminal cleavage/methylation domain-containing protein [Pseudomonas tolaasii]NWC21930.1 prepilin-type N-terminal cleavage/methylation domain-containing protein [Pseudomonas tolaasii]NWC40488.1 prepilin-type N-terminal cleavage/methylation domain-containing p